MPFSLHWLWKFCNSSQVPNKRPECWVWADHWPCKEMQGHTLKACIWFQEKGQDFSCRFETHWAKEKIQSGKGWGFYPQSEKTMGKEGGVSSKGQACVKGSARQWHWSDIVEILPDSGHWLCAHPSGHVFFWRALEARLEQVFSVLTLNFSPSKGRDNRYVLLWSSK